MVDFKTTTELVGDGIRVISVVGERDLYTAPQLEGELATAARDGGTVIVDLTDCTFIDSTALGILANARKRSTVELSLVISDRNILKVFEITSLDRLFTIHPTRAEALLGRGGGRQE
jgi:anti-sigma B factor antagonist